MKYELLKKLKDAGFPQEIKDGLLMYKDGSTCDHSADEEDEVYIPTLSELIDACGDEFVDIQRLDSNRWKASSGLITDKKIGYNCEVTSSTPEEAVSNLYIKLNG